MVSPLKPAIGGYAGPTTSAQLRALITDAVGTGPLMFQGAALGAAMATSLTLTSAGAAAPPLNFSGAPLSGLYDGGANAVGIATNGKPALLVPESGGAGNYVVVMANNTPSVYAAGATNVGLQLSGSGFGGVDLMTNGLNQYLARFSGPGATAANYPVFAATAAGAGPSITATGSDLGIDLILSPKNTIIVLTANGASAAGQPVVTTTNTTGVATGMAVYGAGVPAGATVLSFVAGTSITLSANLTSVGVLAGQTISVGYIGAVKPGIIQASVGTVSLPGFAFAGDVSTGLARLATTALSLIAGGREAVRVPTPSGTNYVQISSSSSPTVAAIDGGGNNPPLQLIGAGSGGVDILASAGGYIGRFTPITSAVNYLQFRNNVATVPPQINAIGTDTDIDINVVTKGAGTFRLGNAGSFAANSTVACTMTALGPTGSRTTIQKWMIVKDNAGNPFYSPLY